MNIAFGPVPSRRLGHSLGINNIPPKSCSYSCLYCQVGATHVQQIEPQVFYTPDEIVRQVSAQLEKLQSTDQSVDYLTFVPDGEPTLDRNLDRTIDRLRPLDIPIAVISNASLLWQDQVRAAITKADWVSLKIDSVNDETWRQLNRPHPELKLERVLDGIRAFTRDFRGTYVTETMLINSVNDNDENIAGIADFIQGINATCSYLAVPTRPTSEPEIRAPNETTLNRCYQILATKAPRVEYLIGYEGDAFAFSGDVKQDLLSITAVHPMRESGIARLLERALADWSVVDELVSAGKLKQITYLGERFYVRYFPTKNADKDG